MSGIRRRAWVGFGILSLLLLSTVLASCFSQRTKVREPFPTPEILENAPQVRVALKRGAPRVEIAVRGGFEVQAADGRTLARGSDLPPTTCRVARGGFLVGTRHFDAPRIRFVPEKDGGLVVDGQAYRGTLLLMPHTAGLLPINHLNLESYVAGVLGNEMPLAWGDDALKAQAIIARTYAVFQMKMRKKKAYDLGADASSQVYRGLKRESSRARKIIAETAGIILTYHWKLFCTYYHSTCGGATVSASSVFGDRDIAPLSGVECGYCRDSKYFRWSHSATPDKLRARLVERGVEVTADPTRIEVLGRIQNGHVEAVRVQTPRETVELPANKFRLLFGPNDLRSTAFDVIRVDGVFEFRGRGWGHGVGLCQIGARGLDRAGFDTLQILEHYFPGAELLRIY